MIKKFLIIAKYNLIILLGLLGLILIIFSFLNLILSGQPRYWEIVHKKSYENLRIEKEKIIQIKRKDYKKSSYLSVFDDNYKNLNYSGSYIKDRCGSLENGHYNLIYQSDKNGFRENIDYRYVYSDYVLIGDSFTQSICENKPNDLKSNLINKTNFSFLNLGMRGTDYPHHYLILENYTKDTEFKGIIWFFYEGNDYETLSSKEKIFIQNYVNQQYSDVKNLQYELKTNHDISLMFRLEVWFAELIRGASVLIKFFKEYENLININDYNYVLEESKKYLDKKKISKRYIVYIPSWQKLSLYKLKKFNLYEKHPQIKQLNKLKDDVKTIAEKNGFHFLDGDKYFFMLKNPLKVFNYKLNTHFNKLGNDVLSNIIVENLN